LFFDVLESQEFTPMFKYQLLSQKTNLEFNSRLYEYIVSGANVNLVHACIELLSEVSFDVVKPFLCDQDISIAYQDTVITKLSDISIELCLNDSEVPAALKDSLEDYIKYDKPIKSNPAEL
jgi:hypothetical protein